MTVAKGRLFVSAEQLATLLQLPDGVEILALRPKVHDDGFEFLLVSADETVLTEKAPLSQIRKIDLELEFVQHTGGVVENVPFPEVASLGKGETIITKTQAEILFDAVDGFTINDIPVQTPKKKDVKDSFEDILKMAQRKQGKF